MRIQTGVKTIKTVCGKTISYFKEGDVLKMHSLEGPAIVYPKEEKKLPEYYVYGVRYTKQKWQELVNLHKATALPDQSKFDM